MNREALVSFYAFHHWAMDRLLAAMETVPEAAIDRPLGGSFGTLGELLRHMLGADTIWLERWHGRSPTSAPEMRSWRGVPDFQREWDGLKAKQRVYLEEVDEAALRQPLGYTNLAGEPSSIPLGDILLHVVNHGTYHRGQIAHMLRQLGERPPSTDYVQFVRERPSASTIAR